MSIQTIDRPAPALTDKHAALSVFLGSWRAEGEIFRHTDQSSANPRGNPSKWRSSHVAEWHSGKFFLFQSEHAFSGPDQAPFDTLSVFGVDEKTGAYFARTFDNLGFHRDYAMAVDGNC